MRGPSAEEICDDGLDNDCDGVADRGVDALGTPACTPYDPDAADRLALDANSIHDTGQPLQTFPIGTVAETDGQLSFAARSGRARIAIPVTDDLDLELPITRALIEGDFASHTPGPGVVNGRLGGILSARDLDATFGIEVAEIGATPEDSLLDVFFANLLGTLIGLPKVSTSYGECMTPDIDVDGDGLEAFCDSDPLDDVNRVDVCIDADGTVVTDTDAVPCTTDPRFVDGISIELNFTAVPAILTTP